MADPRYTPRPLTGYVWWSNYGLMDTESKVEHTREFLIHSVAADFEIPSADVWVEPFQPIPNSNLITWAAYVKNQHADQVRQETARIDELLMTLKELFGGSL